jgi:hypothetical protein
MHVSYTPLTRLLHTSASYTPVTHLLLERHIRRARGLMSLNRGLNRGLNSLNRALIERV